MPITTASLRFDKKCGASGIPDNKKCSKKTTASSPSPTITPSLIGKVALGAGIAVLGISAARRFARRDPNWQGFTAPGEDWDRIEAEARKRGKQWDVFEDNKKANAIACAASKIDHWIREDDFVPTPRCLGGQGAYGNYVVHPSNKYGIKYLKNNDLGGTPNKFLSGPTESLLPEGEILRHANINNVPSPQLYKATDRVLVMEHLNNYSPLSTHGVSSSMFSLKYTAPLQLKRQMLDLYRSLHMSGLVHNDGHLRNIMFNPKTRSLKFIDFGLAEFATENRTSTRDFINELTQVPRRVGLSEYAIETFESRWAPQWDPIENALRTYETDHVDKVVRGYYRSLETALLKSY